MAEINISPHDGVNAILQILLDAARGVLSDNFFGMYLYGSLSSGDFNPGTSDIDFLIVTRRRLSADEVTRLRELHERIHLSGLPWADHLEGRYLPLDEAHRYAAGRLPTPNVNEGEFLMDGEGSDWIIQRHIIREGGLALAGPPPQTLIDAVPPDDLKQAVLGIMDSWWAPMLENHEFLKNGGYQAFAVLTMCRTLYTLEHGTIASKPASARWAQRELAPRWHRLIEQALAMEHDSPVDILNETLAFIRYARDACSRLERRAV
jgi:hypothetical protein